MTRAIGILIFATLILSGCGDDDADDQVISTSSTTSSTTEEPGASLEEYADAIRDGFTETYDGEQAGAEEMYDLVRSLEPPTDRRAEHSRLVSAAQRYAEAWVDADFSDGARLNDLRRVVIERIYEATDMDYDDLFRELNS